MPTLRAVVERSACLDAVAPAAPRLCVAPSDATRYVPAVATSHSSAINGGAENVSDVFVAKTDTRRSLAAVVVTDGAVANDDDDDVVSPPTTSIGFDALAPLMSMIPPAISKRDPLANVNANVDGSTEVA